MTEFQLNRGIWMLENQINTADDLIGFWKVMGLEL